MTYSKATAMSDDDLAPSPIRRTLAWSGGALLLIVSSRGRYVTGLERILGISGGYEWRPTGPAESASSTDLQSFLAKRTRFDPDLWVVEVDIADPERFIAETTALG